MRTSRSSRLLAIAAVAALIAIGASVSLSGCQTKVVTSSAADRDTVTVAGTGVALTRPDRASVTFGVTADAPNAKTAMNRAATTADAVTKALKAAGIADKDLQTTAVTVSPQYSYTSNVTRVSGYEASVQVRARITDLGKVAAAVAAGTNAGATNIYGPEFSLSNDNPAKFDALDQAVADAKAKAKAVAEASGRSLGPVISVTEAGAASAYPFAAMSYAAGAPKDAASPQILPGQLEDRANVTVVFTLQ